MDIEYIREKIYNLDEKRKIQHGEFLSAEVIDLLRQGNSTSRAACFVKTNETAPSKNVHLFPPEITCSDCGRLTVQNISKTSLFNYLQGNCKILCDECQQVINMQKEKKKEIALVKKEEGRKKIQENTQLYIKNYLDPNQSWSKEISPKERTYLIIGLSSNIDYSEVSKYIKNMSYDDFLNTPYWEVISDYKKFKSNYKCALCGNGNNLATHHVSYARHGREHEHKVINEDLIVLCKDCHSKFHDKI